MSGSNVASWPAYRFLKRQVRWCGILISLRAFQFFVIHTVKGFNIVSEAEVDVFLKFSCFFYLHWMLAIWSSIRDQSAFSKSSFYIWKSLVHILLKPSLKDFEHYLASIWDECNCMVVLTFFAIALLWDWNENWRFPGLWPLLSFPN